MTLSARKLNWQDWPILGRWSVEPSHPVLAGHFPGQPLVPGALLLSWLATNVRRAHSREVIEIREARFQGAALPGANLEARVLANSAPNTFRFAIVETASLSVMASGTLVLADEITP